MYIIQKPKFIIKCTVLNMCRMLSLSDRVLYPIRVTRNCGVNARVFGSGASKSPTDDAAQVETIVVGHTRQRATRVALKNQNKIVNVSMYIIYTIKCMSFVIICTIHENY